MKITSAEFVKSAVDPSQCPKDGLPEIVLIGRSNVGKSSLINAFVNRKGLAKTSSQPGKTRTINFYLINNRFYLVDLPGFGYSNVPLSVKKSWEKMIEDYFECRDTLQGAFVILDPRRDAGDVEERLYRWIEAFGIPAVTVFTKTDKLSNNRLSARIAAIKKAIPVVEPVLFSAVTGQGKVLLGKKVAEVLEVKAPPANENA
ncbi:MAG: ribosome biogenesis GTP-binding protein YihA/YsxC [Deltaproteobacteria bacterium]